MFVDEYAHLENLEDARTRRLIEEANSEVEKILGEKARTHHGRLLERLRAEVPISVVGLDDSYALLFRSELGGYVSLNGKTVASGSKDEIFNAAERVQNTASLSVSVGLEGSDEGFALIVDQSGQITHRFEGLYTHFFQLRGKLGYVRAYRKEPSPDGVDPPVERVFVGGELFPIQPRRGDGVAVKIKGESVALLVSHGWSNGTLYFGEGAEPSKVDEGKIVGFGIVGNQSYYVKENTLMASGRPLFDLENPVLEAKFDSDGVVLKEIEGYRTSLVKRSYTGETLWRYRAENVYSYDLLRDRVVVLETSFTTQYRLVELVAGTPRSIREGRKEDDVAVKDIYIGGKPTLHAFLLSKKKPRGVVVYGYGGFAIPLLPSYNPLFHELLDSGYSIIVANLRGGYEHGEEWHRQGMLENKTNVFQDFAQFISLARMFGARVAAMGASNGGLLVGATLNAHPELLDCAVIGYPVLDMLNYHRFLAGAYWIHEYGDPDGAQREYLAAYSPYHNLRGGLPPTLVYTGLNDDRVHPIHALKYVAKSRALGNQAYLYVNERSGHNLSDPDSKACEMGYIVAFIERVLGDAKHT